MAKKQKNLKQKEAFHRKERAGNAVAEFGMSLDDQLCSVGIIIEHIGYSQLAFDILKSVEKFCLNYVGINVNFIVQKQNPSLIKPLCPMLDITHLVGWKNPLITTDLLTTRDAVHTMSDNICYYIYDLEFMDRWELSTSMFNDIFQDPRVIFITRHQTYREILETEFGISVCNEIMPKFDLNQIMRMLLKEKRND